MEKLLVKPAFQTIFNRLEQIFFRRNQSDGKQEKPVRSGRFGIRNSIF